MATEAALVYPGAMSDQIKPYEPGIYVKGDKTRRAETRADAVAAIFEGYVLDASQDAGADSVDPAEETENDDPVNGVGTLGTGEASEDDTPDVPTPSTLFGSTSTF